MKPIILFFLLFISSVAVSQKSIRLVLNPLECISCYAGHIALEKMDVKIPIEFVFGKMNKSTLERFLKRSLLEILVNERNVKIVVSDSLYNELFKSGFSEVYVYENQNLIEQFKFKDIWKRESRENVIVSDLAYRSTINDSSTYKPCEDILLESGLDYLFPTLRIDESLIAILDPQLNVCHLFDRKGKLIQQVDGLDFSPNDLIPLNHGIRNDSTLQKHLKQLKSMGYYSLMLEDVVLVDAKVFIAASLPYLFPKPGSDRIVLESLTTVALLNSNNTLTPLFSDTVRSNEFIAYRNFSIEDSLLILPGFRESSDGKFSYSITRTPINSNGKHSYRWLPDIQMNGNTFHSTVQELVRVKDGLLHIQHTSCFVHLESGIQYCFPELVVNKPDSNPDSNETFEKSVLDWIYSSIDSTMTLIYKDIQKNSLSLLKRSLHSAGHPQDAGEILLPLGSDEVFALAFESPDKFFVMDRKSHLKCYLTAELGKTRRK